MAKLLAVRVQERGISIPEATNWILQRGYVSFAIEMGAGNETAKKFAQDVCQIPNPPAFTQDDLRDNEELINKLVHEIFNFHQDIVKENQELKEKLRQIEQRDANKRAVEKTQLITMLNIVRDQKKALEK